LHRVIDAQPALEQPGACRVPYSHAAGCQPDLGGGSAALDDNPMRLPAGWVTTYTTHTETNTDPGSDVGPRDLECRLIRHEAPQTASYCGYLIHVSADAFSFDARPRPFLSFLYGELTYTVRGAGDAQGSEINARYEQVGGGGYWYDVTFTVTHLEEL